MNRSVEMTPIRRKLTKKTEVVPQNTSQNNNIKSNISNITRNVNINTLKVNISNNFFNDIDTKIKTINDLINAIEINSYFNNLNYNNDEDIKNVFKTFIDKIDSIEKSAIELKAAYNNEINQYKLEIKNKNQEIDSISNRIKEKGNVTTNIIRNAIAPFKIVKDDNIRLFNKLLIAEKKLLQNHDIFESKLDNLKVEFKEVLYNKIVDYYNSFISKDSINLNITKNTIIPNLIKLTKIIKDGKEYLKKMENKIVMSLGNGNNYNLNGNNSVKITEKINSIKIILDDLEKNLKEAIEALKNKLTNKVGQLKESIKNKIIELINKIKNCIEAIKSNTSLKAIQNDLKALQTKYKNLEKDLNTSFNSIFNKNSNVKANEAKLNKLLNGLEKLFKNSSSGLVVNTNRSIPVNNGRNRGSNTSSVTTPVTTPVTHNFVNGKKYQKVINTSDLTVGNTLLWKSQQKRPMKGNINKINRAKKEVTIKKPYYIYPQKPTNNTQKTLQNGLYVQTPTIKFNEFNKKNVKVQVPKSPNP